MTDRDHENDEDETADTEREDTTDAADTSGGERVDAGPVDAGGVDESEPQGPLSGLREDIEERRERRRDSAPAVEDVFESGSEEPVLDGEQVWEDLLAGQADEAGMLAFGEKVEGETADVRIIPDRICHNCEYFADPPDLHCNHDGTEIRRLVDMEHYEVVDCPVVKHRSDLDGQ